MVSELSGPSPSASCRSLTLAWLALLSNALLLALLIPWWLWDPHLRTANLVVGLAAVLPIAATGIVGALAELRCRRWGRIVSIVALSLALLLELSYGITRLALVADGRPGLAIACAFSWILTVLLLLERSLRPLHPLRPAVAGVAATVIAEAAADSADAAGGC
ncbi:MAG: hypothetical protein ACKOCM_00350 [Cyanobacteriota bacterium]